MAEVFWRTREPVDGVDLVIGQLFMAKNFGDQGDKFFQRVDRHEI